MTAKQVTDLVKRLLVDLAYRSGFDPSALDAPAMAQWRVDWENIIADALYASGHPMEE